MGSFIADLHTHAHHMRRRRTSDTFGTVWEVGAVELRGILPRRNDISVPDAWK